MVVILHEIEPIEEACNPLQDSLVVPFRMVVILHEIEPIEEACNPLQLRWGFGLADDLRVRAEIDRREERISALVSSPLTQVVIQFAVVACSSGLNHTTSPPAAALHICSALGFAKERRC